MAVLGPEKVIRAQANIAGPMCNAEKMETSDFKTICDGMQWNTVTQIHFFLYWTFSKFRIGTLNNRQLNQKLSGTLSNLKFYQSKTLQNDSEHWKKSSVLDLTIGLADNPEILSAGGWIVTKTDKKQSDRSASCQLNHKKKI